METVGEAGPARLRFACPSCGRKYATRPDMAGKKIRCNNCGGGVWVPQADGSPSAPPSRPALKTFGKVDGSNATPHEEHEDTGDPGDGSSLLDGLASIEGVKRRKKAEAILPSRTEAMEQVRQKVAEQEAAQAQKDADKAKKKKRKKKTGYFDPKDTMILVGSTGALVALLALIAWGYPHFRFPLGGVLCILGFIVYLLGLAALRQLVAEEGPMPALLFRFFPPYQWWFVATHWADTKDYVAFFGSGLIILAIGGAVIKSSPAGKEAEESERAYQKAQRGNQAEIPPAMPIMPGGDEN